VPETVTVWPSIRPVDGVTVMLGPPADALGTATTSEPATTALTAASARNVRIRVLLMLTLT
jgi:hypothetical protein